MKSDMASFFTRKRTAIEERDYPRHADVVRSAVASAFRSLEWKPRVSQSGTFQTSWTIQATWTGSFWTEGSVVIRILKVDNVTRVRVESVARRGGFDFGENKNKVREFFLKLDLSLPR